MRAEAVLDKTERKVERIKVKEKAVKERSVSSLLNLRITLADAVVVCLGRIK